MDLVPEVVKVLAEAVLLEAAQHDRQTMTQVRMKFVHKSQYMWKRLFGKFRKPENVICSSLARA